MKNRIPTLDNFINESEINLDDTSFKKNNTVFRLMTRFNPQLGTYYVFTTVKIDKITSVSVICDDGHKYDKMTGEQKDESSSAYGSAYYTIMNLDNARTEFARLKQSGGNKVRGMEKYLDVK